MAVLRKIVKIIDKINEVITKSTCYVVIPLVLTLCYEVLVRYGFDSPTQWSYDATYMFCSFPMVLGLAYTWQIGGHVNVDIITGNFSKRVQAAIFCFFMATIFFMTWGLIIKVLGPHVIHSWVFKERSATGSMPPIYPFKTWIFAGVILLFLQGISEFIKQLYLLVTGKELVEVEVQKFEC